MTAVPDARTLFFESPGIVRVRPDPLSAEPGSILVESRFMGISHGTELLAFRGELPDDIPLDGSLPLLCGPATYPLKYGYSNAGVTEDGKRVFAFAPHQDRFCARQDELVYLPDDIDFRDAVFLPNMETALSIVQDLDARRGEAVLIVGQGVVGLLVAEILRRDNFGTVITVDRYDMRVRASEAIGCRAFSAGLPGLLREIRHAAGDRGVDAAVNLSGSGEGLQLAIDALAFGASVVEASWYGTRTVALSLGSAFHRRRLSIRSNQVSTIAPELGGRWTKGRRIEAALELLRLVRPSRFITHAFALSDAQNAFDLIAGRPDCVIQVCLEP